MLQLSDIQKVFTDALVIASWTIGMVITLLVAAKRREMREEIGVSVRTYMTIVVLVEIFYVLGAVMILSAMGVNMMKHLAELRFWKCYEIVNRLDWRTVKLVSVAGWVGFVINRTVSFLSPGYLLLAGGRKLPRYFYYSAWLEIGVETSLTALILFSLIAD